MITEEMKKETRTRFETGRRVQVPAVGELMPLLAPVAAVVAGIGFRELGVVGGLAGVLVFVVLLAVVYGGEDR